MITCESTLISGYEYNDQNWVLSLKFRGTGEVRHYQDVSPEIFDDLKRVDADPNGSVGRFCNANIFKKFNVLTDSSIPIEAYEQPVEEPKRPATLVELRQQLAQPDPSPEPQLGDVMPPEQAADLAPTSKKMDAVDKLAARVQEMLAKPLPEIKDQASYELVQTHVNDLKRESKVFVDLVDPFVKIAHKAYKEQFDKKAAVEKPVKEVIDRLNRLLNNFEAERERIAREAAEAARRQAEEEEEAERRRRSEELTLAAVDDKLADGDQEGAEMLFTTPIEAPRMPVYTPRVEPGFQSVAGTSKRPSWSGTVTDIEELILDVAEGIKLKREGKDPGGHAPSTFLAPAQTAINAQAKASRDTKVFPGIRFENNPIRSSRS